jgi:hypothetical protein
MPFQGFTQSNTITVTCSTAAYTAKDNIGGLMTMQLAKGHLSGVIQTLVLSDAAAQAKEMDVVFFNANPTTSTFTDNAALIVSDADLKKICGVATVTASDYKVFNVSSTSNCVASVNPSIQFHLNNTSVLYLGMVDRSAYDAAATTDLGLIVSILG